VSAEDAIKVEATVVEVLPNTTFRVELSNRHRLLAHLPGRMKAQAARISLGDRVTVEMSPFDLSQGCIKFRE
jgi:translation initiation factor IF-1